jgi:DHA2 family multidrug resistance protein
MDGANIALVKLSGMVRQQATLMSFIDVFLILTGLFVALAFFATMMKKPGDVPKEAAGH